MFRATLFLLPFIIAPAFSFGAPPPAAKAPPKAATAEKSAESTPQSIKIPGNGELVLAIPKGWKTDIKSPPAGQDGPVEISIHKGDTKAFVTELTPIPPPRRPMKDFNTPEKLRKMADGSLASQLPNAKEKDVPIVELKGPQSLIYHFSVTDKNAKPGEFENLTECVGSVGEMIVVMSILTHEKAAPEVAQALEILKSATQTALPEVAAGDAPGDAPDAGALTGDFRVGPPGGAWALVVPAEGFKVSDDQSDKAHAARNVTMENEESGLIVSIFMEKAPKPGDAKIVRDTYWGRAKQSPLKKTGITLGKSGDFTTVQYMIPEVGGQKVNQRNVNFYAVHEGTWIDIHLSKIEFTEKDQALFDAITKGAKFEKTPAAKPAAKKAE